MSAGFSELPIEEFNRGPVLAGTLIANFGGFGYAAVTISFSYILGFAATLFLSETRGNPLPEGI